MKIYYDPSLLNFLTTVAIPSYTEECYLMLTDVEKNSLRLLDEEAVKEIGDRKLKFRTPQEIANRFETVKNLQAQFETYL